VSFIRLQTSIALPVTLRASRKTDASLFYDVTEQTMRVHVIAAGGTWEEEGRRREAAEDSVNPDASVIMVGKVYVGIMCVERQPHEIHLHMLCLLPGYQACGIGGSLVSALQREAAAHCLSCARVCASSRCHLVKWCPSPDLGIAVRRMAGHKFASNESPAFDLR
jgi:ribosomal protein S18 acetylase RimI-like enzyme